ncbi:MAG: 4Fe-4S dicluster domain-containing protein [Patescibacteria group bacterium]|jgi:NAD-dependent dihydropyrimidine dehydrogenase PreA subunit|nr:4Fe-4S ferredoxin [Patescibacteria group bacterium]
MAHTAKKFEEKGKTWTQFPKQCKSCYLCIATCPQKCLSQDEKVLGYYGQPSVKCDIKNCVQCKKCETICPDLAIRVKD